MAIVTRYFSTAGAGDADGTSWANRAALISGGVYSSVITSFDFSGGSDSLLCLIGPGNYSVGAVGISPTVANPCTFHGCDSSGNALVKPDSWSSAQACTWESSLPVLDSGGNAFVNLAETNSFNIRLIKITASRNGGAIGQLNKADWCVISNAGSGSSASAVATGIRGSNCVMRCTGDYAYVCAPSATLPLVNCRVEGNKDSGSQTKRGFQSASRIQLIRCTSVNNKGAGIYYTTTTGGYVDLSYCTLTNNDGSGIDLSAHSSGNLLSHIMGSVLTGNGAYGLNGQPGVFVVGNRFRDNTSGNINNLGNWSTTFDNYTTDSDDATEFVDAAGGDYRIKASSAIWGKGYGAGDEIPTAAAIATAVWARSGRSLTA